MLDFIGKFHPLFVHLPIGMLVMALIFKGMSLIPRWQSFTLILPLILGFSFISSVATCITGYLLSLSGEYGSDLVTYHQWAGIVLTLLNGLLFLVEYKYNHPVINNVLWVTLGIAMTAAGHLGGSITHGEDFLSFSNETKKVRFIENLDHAVVYKDLIVPILEDNCYACHSSKKQKGMLRVDAMDHIMKGGENGPLLQAGAPENSLLIERLELPELDELHMPPKGRPQLLEQEIQILEWWIAMGTPVEDSFGAIPNHEAIKEVMAEVYQKPESEIEVLVPEEHVTAAPPEIIKALKDSGAVVLPVGLNSHYLSLNLLEKPLTQWHTDQLLQIKKQLIWLKADHCELTDKHLSYFGQLKRLITLDLSDNAITDKNLHSLSSLKSLRRLNLSNTKITAKGLESLQELPDLEKIYIYQSGVTENQQDELRESMGPITIDFGGYENLIFAVRKELIDSTTNHPVN